MKKQTYYPFRDRQRKENYLSYYAQEAAKLPVASDSRYVETTFGKTFVRIHGNQNNPALILLQGISSTSLIWKDYVEELSAKYCVYTIDNIYDVGLSMNTMPIKNIGNLLDWFNQVLAGLYLSKKINIIGMSYGGWVASQFALQYPQKIDKLILIAPAATVHPLRPIFMLKSLLMFFPFKTFVKHYIYWILQDMVDKGGAHKSFVDRYINELMLNKECFEYRPLVTPSVLEEDDLKKLKSTLLIIGENEKMYLAKHASQRVKNVAPDIEVNLISGVGHDLIFMQKDMIIKKIFEFLNPSNIG